MAMPPTISQRAIWEYKVKDTLSCFAHPLAADDGGEDLAAVLEADEVRSVDRHPTNEADRQAHPGQVVRDEAVDHATDPRASEKEKKRPAAAHLGNYERNRPAWNLNQCSKEVALVNVSFAQV